MPPIEDHIDAGLLVRISRGEEQAFSELFHRYRNRVYAIALRITASEPLAEEVLLDVFLKVWLKREELTQIDHFTAWLFTITRHQVFSSLKALALRRRVEAETVRTPGAEPQPADPVGQLVDKEYRQLLHDAIERLPPQQKKVYCLIKEQGLKREEAARVLNLSPETVKRHLADAMQAIRGHCLSRAEIYSLLFVLEQLL